MVDTRSYGVRTIPENSDNQLLDSGEAFCFNGSAIVWLASSVHATTTWLTGLSPDSFLAAPRELLEMDLGDSEPTAHPLREVTLPEPNAEERAANERCPDCVRGDWRLLGAGHGKAVIGRLKTDPGARGTANHLYPVETDGSVRDLGAIPKAENDRRGFFSPDGKRFAYPDSAWGGASYGTVTNIFSFDLEAAQPAGHKLNSPFPQPQMPYDEVRELWWTADGKLRMGGNALTSLLAQEGWANRRPSVWQLRGGRWTLIHPEGFLLDVQLPDGDSAVVTETVTAPDHRRVDHLSISHQARLVHIADGVDSVVAAPRERERSAERVLN